MNEQMGGGMIMERKIITSKRIGITLMLVFLIGLVVLTIYSRGYVQRQKPLVSITFPTTAALSWDYETRSTIEEAAPHFVSRGHNWTVEVHIPRFAYEMYMLDLLNIEAAGRRDDSYVREPLPFITRQIFDNGDYIYTFGYPDTDDDFPPFAGLGISVRLEYTGMEEFDFMIPPSAVHRNPFTDEPHIFTVHRRDGAWGFEYYVRQESVALFLPTFIDGMANVFPMTFFDEPPVVYWSDEDLYDGALVRLWD